MRPQDDFYQYANGGWLARTPIPKAESRWGSFIMLRHDTDKKLKAILDDLATLKRAAAGSPEQMIRDFQKSGMDMKARSARKATPLAPLRKKIAAIENTQDLQDVIAELHTYGVGAPFNIGVDQDAKNTSRYLLHLFQDGLGMPDRDYYLNEDAESKRVRTAYIPHIERTFRLLGYTSAKAKEAATTVMRMETALAKESMNKVDRRDIDKTYNKHTLAELKKLAPGIDWTRYFARIHGKGLTAFVVMQPKYIGAVAKMLSSVPLSDWKIYLEWQLASDYSGLLSSAFVREQFAFYGTTLTGVAHMKPLWRRTLAVVNGSVGELLGKIYVAKHFTPAAKKRMNELVDDLFEAYAARLKSLDWMSPTTKKKALAKLSAMGRKIGYPDKWKSYNGLVIRPDDYFGNALRAAQFHHKREMKKLRGPIDKHEWFMYPQTVNAYNAPNMNEIAFPAAILQPPFFDLTGDPAMNYGCIGAVIGHEITHGFDDEGAKYDAKGNLKNWWTPADKKKFQAKSAIVVKQYSDYQVFDGVRVNGQLTLGENIADYGGVSIAYDALQRNLERTGNRKVVHGLTPEQRFFLGFALFERENTRPEVEKTLTLTDPHSPGKFRINGPLANFDKFYEAYGVKKGDKLYREPTVRTMVW